VPDSGLLPIGAVSAHTMHWLLTPQFVQQPCSSRIECTSSPSPGAPGADSSFHPALGHHRGGPGQLSSSSMQQQPYASAPGHHVFNSRWLCRLQAC
jgi:hypothetical protein